MDIFFVLNVSKWTKFWTFVFYIVIVAVLK